MLANLVRRDVSKELSRSRPIMQVPALRECDVCYRLAAQRPALVLSTAAPNAVLLVGRHGEFEARCSGGADSADFFCCLDLICSRSCRTDREEQLRVRVSADGLSAPVGCVPIVCADPSQSHRCSRRFKWFSPNWSCCQC